MRKLKVPGVVYILLFMLLLQFVFYPLMNMLVGSYADIEDKLRAVFRFIYGIILYYSAKGLHSIARMPDYETQWKLNRKENPL